MSGIDLSATMDALASCAASAGLTTTTYPYPAETVEPPAWVVGYPDTIEIGVTYDRGADRATFPLFLVAGRNDSLTARDFVSQAILGAQNVADALEPTLGGVVQVVNVASVKVSHIEISGVPMIAAEFSCEVTS